MVKELQATSVALLRVPLLLSDVPKTTSAIVLNLLPLPLVRVDIESGTKRSNRTLGSTTMQQHPNIIHIGIAAIAIQTTTSKSPQCGAATAAIGVSAPSAQFITLAEPNKVISSVQTHPCLL